MVVLFVEVKSMQDEELSRGGVSHKGLLSQQPHIEDSCFQGHWSSLAKLTITPFKACHS